MTKKEILVGKYPNHIKTRVYLKLDKFILEVTEEVQVGVV
jgi:hypothetical protein